MDQPKNFLITDLEQHSPIVEAFRTLRANIRFIGVDRPICTLLVTSPEPTEGKSTISANLAVASAISGKRVLAINADLRRPSLHKFFRCSNSFGLTNVLLGQRSLSDSIQKTKVEDLFCITSGPLPPNPAELLGSKRMDDLLSDVKDEFDFVLIDSPPVLPVSDVLLLAPKADGCILVTASMGTKREAAKAALDALNKTKARVVGTVLNNFQADQPNYYYYYYYEDSEAGL